MVKRHLLIVTLVATAILLTLTGTATAQIQYHLDYEWAKIWINQDGSIDLLYNMSVTCDSGTITYVNVGQPTTNFTIQSAKDLSGQALTTLNTGDARARVYLSPSISSGQTGRFTLLTNVPNMIYDDSTMNPGYLGMMFIPSTYDARIVNQRVLIVLPSGVTKQNVKTNMNWDNAFNDTETGRFAVYWERHDLAPGQENTFGVSFPKEFLPNYEPSQPPVNPPPNQPPGFPSIDITFWQPLATIFLVFGIIVALIGVVAYAGRKHMYLTPSIGMETLGIKHGLTAVEASYLLDQKPTKIVTEILYSLLQKRAVWVESAAPSLKLRIMQAFQDKTGPKETPLRYYELDFLNAIKKDGALDEEKLAKTIMFLRDTVEEKMRGYCRRDTIDYYKGVATKAWEQVEQAGTPELASKAYDEQLLWLFLDPNYQSRTEFAFRNRAFEPSPFWLWYWYSYQFYHPNPTYRPNIEALPPKTEIPTKTAQTPAQMPQPQTQAAKPPTIPGSDFANNMVKAVENTSNNIVANLEKFANSIIPAPPPAQKASNQPAHHASSCVCACAACACVCACVSCACACASGGVG